MAISSLFCSSFLGLFPFTLFAISEITPTDVGNISKVRYLENMSASATSAGLSTAFVAPGCGNVVILPLSFTTAIFGALPYTYVFLT